MIDFIYSHGSISASCEGKHSSAQLIHCVKLFKLGDKYEVHGLQESATASLIWLLRSAKVWSCQALLELIDAAYEWTMPRSKIRRIVCYHVLQGGGQTLLNSTAHVEPLQERGEFLYDMVHMKTVCPECMPRHLGCYGGIHANSTL